MYPAPLKRRALVRLGSVGGLEINVSEGIQTVFFRNNKVDPVDSLQYPVDSLQ